MPTRQKNGRTVAELPPAGRAHGRLGETPAAVPVAGDAAELSRAYVAAALSREHARRTAEGGSSSTPYRTAQRHAEKLSQRLARLPGGRDVLARANLALASRAVRYAVGLAARAHLDGRDFAIEAAATIADVILEHDVRSASALMLLGGAAAKHAAASMCMALAMQRGPALMTRSRSQAGDDGAAASATLAAFQPLVQVAIAAQNSARGDVLSALDLEQRSRAEGRQPAAAGEAFVADAMKQLRERHAERARLAEQRRAEAGTRVPVAPEPVEVRVAEATELALDPAPEPEPPNPEEALRRRYLAEQEENRRAAQERRR